MNALVQSARGLDPRQWQWADMVVGDLDEVLGIEQAVYSHPWTRGNFIDSLAAGQQAWVLRERLGGELLAYCVSLRVLDECHLLNIAVARSHWGQGFAKLTLQRLCEHEARQGVRQLWLEVRAGNARAQQLYESLGFARQGLRKGYYPDTPAQREDAIVMRRDLPEVPA